MSPEHRGRRAQETLRQSMRSGQQERSRKACRQRATSGKVGSWQAKRALIRRCATSRSAALWGGGELGGFGPPVGEREGQEFDSMAIYHMTAKIVARKSGRSVVAAAAYRAAQSLEEDASGITHDYTRKVGVEHSEILAPEGAPNWVFDRAALWNAVEGTEKRKDAQLAREVEVGLPIELDDASQVALLRDYVRREFVARGMVADFSIHRDDPNNPHAHILLTMRRLTAQGFGLKERSWNERAKLLDWRRGWEEVTNESWAHAGLAVRIDHRSLKAQGLTLEPGRKIGVGLERQRSGELPDRIADRVAEQREIARENGERILIDPTIALKGLTHGQATFSRQDLAKFLHTRTDRADQFQAA